MKKTKKRFNKNNQMVLMTLKEFIDHFQQESNNSASTLLAMKETISIMREEHKTEINKLKLI